MPTEKSAGAIIFTRDKGKIYYLLLHYPGFSHRGKKDYWDFPKGHIEKGEKEVETIKREIKEETGLKDIRFIKGYREVIKYFFKFEGKNIFKTVVFYLAETKNKEIKISFEHQGYQWLSFDKALKKVTYKNAKELLKKANSLLSG